MLFFIVKLFKNFSKNNQFLRSCYRKVYLFKRKRLSKLGVVLVKSLNFQVLTRNDLTAIASKYNSLAFSEEEFAKLPRSYTIEPVLEGLLLAVEPLQLKYPQPFVCEINNARIIGSPTVTFDSEGKIVLETGIPRYTKIASYIATNLPLITLIKHKFFKPKLNLSQLDTACLFFNIWTNNYYHWLIDLLTLVEGLEYYYQQTGIKPKLIVEPKMRSWQKESLNLLGYAENDWIVWNQKGFSVKKLIIPSFRRAYDGNIYGEASFAACRWLRDRILSNLPTSDRSFFEHILISRKKALNRRIANEDEVMDCLTSMGFAAYFLEEMSFTDQVRLFSRAKIVIASHGAGLTNLIFGDNLTVIELFGCSVPNGAYANLARGLGFKYGCLSCASPRPNSPSPDDDMVVDVKQLSDLLEMMKL
jgi:Glycosyltransferase 61